MRIYLTQCWCGFLMTICRSVIQASKNELHVSPLSWLVEYYYSTSHDSGDRGGRRDGELYSSARIMVFVINISVCYCRGLAIKLVVKFVHIALTLHHKDGTASITSLVYIGDNWLLNQDSQGMVCYLMIHKKTVCITLYTMWQALTLWC